MDIGHIEGNGGVERGSDRPQSLDRQRNQVHGRAGATPDSAAISNAGREALQSADALAERARHAGDDRQAAVEAARLKLADGTLDSTDAVLGAARGLLDAGF